MKNGKSKCSEYWWLGLVVLFYILYNLPGVPKYGDVGGALRHALLTLVPLWVIIYFGLIRFLYSRKQQ